MPDWYVDRRGNVRPFYTPRPVVGPVLSIVNGRLVFSLFMTNKEILALCLPKYQQPQLSKG